MCRSHMSSRSAATPAYRYGSRPAAARTSVEAIDSRTSPVSASGTLVRRRDASGATLLEGTSGSLQGARWRWDITRTEGRGTLLALTGDVREAMASTLVRAAGGREPYLYAGVAAIRELMWMRYMLAGIPF